MLTKAKVPASVTGFPEKRAEALAVLSDSSKAMQEKQLVAIYNCNQGLSQLLWVPSFRSLRAGALVRDREHLVGFS